MSLNVPDITTCPQRYAILMHRIQAPEDAAVRPLPPPPPPTPSALAAAAALRRAAANRHNDLESQPSASTISAAGQQDDGPAANQFPAEPSTWRGVVASVSNPESKTCA